MAKGFSQLMLIITVVSISAVGIGYWLYSSQKLPSFIFQAVPQPGVFTLPPSQISIAPLTVTSSPTSQVVVGDPVTPGVFKGDVRNLPTVTPFSITPVIGQDNLIKVQLSKSIYGQGETIEVKVINITGKDLSYLDGSGCGVILERQTSNGWQSQQISSSEGSLSPCTTMSITDNQSKTFVRKIDSNPPSGTYRVHFQYYSGNVYSSQFAIN